MKVICDNRDIKTTVMPEQYYILLRERQSIEADLRPLWNEQSRLRNESQKQSENAQRKDFVNSYEEATKREITTVTYQRSQKRMEQAVLRNLGA